MARPHTAATTTVYDGSRIKNTLKFLEDIEAKIELDIEKIQDGSDVARKGVRLSKQMVLDSSMCDELSEVQMVMVRDKNIESVDDNKREGGLLMEDLCNIECFYASHNLISDCYGIGLLTSLVELNLNNNRIADAT